MRDWERRSATMQRWYRRGMNTREIGEKLGCSAGTVRNCLLRCGTSFRSTPDRHRKYLVDHGAFDRHSEERSYWAGFLMADGSVMTDPLDRRSARIEVHLAARDAEHLELLRKFVGSTAPIRLGRGFASDRKAHDYAVLSLSSTPIARALARFGVVPRKTKRTKVRLLSRDRDFWRGVIDGDGSMGFWINDGVRVPTISLVGSMTLLQQFLNFVKTIGIKTEVTVRRRRDEKLCAVSFARQSAAHIVTALYDGASIALARKVKVAKRIIAEV